MIPNEPKDLTTQQVANKSSIVKRYKKTQQGPEKDPPKDPTCTKKHKKKRLIPGHLDADPLIRLILHAGDMSYADSDSARWDSYGFLERGIGRLGFLNFLRP